MAEPRRTLMDLVEAFERVHRQYQAIPTEPKKVKLTPRQRFMLKMEKMKKEEKKNDA